MPKENILRLQLPQGVREVSATIQYLMPVAKMQSQAVVSGGTLYSLRQETRYWLERTQPPADDAAFDPSGVVILEPGLPERIDLAGDPTVTASRSESKSLSERNLHFHQKGLCLNGCLHCEVEGKQDRCVA